MKKGQDATIIQRIRFIVYKYAIIFVMFVSIAASFAINGLNIMNDIINNAAALSVTGAAIAAFLFTMQSILLAIPAKNAYMQLVRKHSDYLIDIHRFCRFAEIAFLVNLIPMIYMNKERTVLNITVLAVYIGSLIFTIWSMYIMGSVLIKCERHADDKSEAG